MAATQFAVEAGPPTEPPFHGSSYAMMAHQNDTVVGYSGLKVNRLGIMIRHKNTDSCQCWTYWDRKENGIRARNPYSVCNVRKVSSQ